MSIFLGTGTEIAKRGLRRDSKLDLILSSSEIRTLRVIFTKVIASERELGGDFRPPSIRNLPHRFSRTGIGVSSHFCGGIFGELATFSTFVVPPILSTTVFMILANNSGVALLTICLVTEKVPEVEGFCSQPGAIFCGATVIKVASYFVTLGNFPRSFIVSMRGVLAIRDNVFLT